MEGSREVIWGVILRFLLCAFGLAIVVSLILCFLPGNDPSRVDDVYNKIQSGYTVIVDGTEVKSGVTKDMIRLGIEGKTYLVDDDGKQVVISLGR